MMTLITVVSDFQENQYEFHKYLRTIFIDFVPYKITLHCMSETEKQFQAFLSIL